MHDDNIFDPDDALDCIITDEILDEEQRDQDPRPGGGCLVVLLGPGACLLAGAWGLHWLV